MNIVTKANGSLLKVGESLATSTACCCSTCYTSATCSCLPSSFLVSIPSWTCNGFNCAAQTVTAYKCCFTDNSRLYIIYRSTLINVGTFDYYGCTTPMYFYVYFLYGTLTNQCQVLVSYGLLSQIKASISCTYCETAPLVITPLTACYKITQYNQCGWTNTLDSGYDTNVYWASLSNCSCPHTAPLNQKYYQYNLGSSNCSLLNSVNLTLSPSTTFTITIT